MKKILPLLLFVLLVFAGCQSGPAVYEPTENPREIVVHAEKFVNKVAKKSKHYTAEEWDATVGQFVAMCKNYFENSQFLSTEEQTKFDYARLKFMDAITAAGKDDVAIRVKEEYSHMIGN